MNSHIFLAFLACIVSSAIILAEAQPAKRAGSCSSYTIITTRGTGEAQGASAGFRTMNRNILSTYRGGEEYDTVYPAGASQDSSQGTRDIVRKVKELVDRDAGHCIFLQGYSQGAAATTNAMPQITGNYFDAIKKVIMLGNPLHAPGLSCNIDEVGGTQTKNAMGISYTGRGNSVPSAWQAKTLDICKYGDGVCDRQHGYGITYQHLNYPNNQKTQSIGQDAMAEQLK